MRGSKRAKKRDGVYYRKGWRYAVNGEERGPFKTSREAGIAWSSEKYFLRSIRRVRDGERMTSTDERLEREAAGIRGAS